MKRKARVPAARARDAAELDERTERRAVRCDGVLRRFGYVTDAAAQTVADAFTTHAGAPDAVHDALCRAVVLQPWSSEDDAAEIALRAAEASGWEEAVRLQRAAAAASKYNEFSARGPCPQCAKVETDLVVYDVQTRSSDEPFTRVQVCPRGHVGRYRGDG